jgi:hypothetical protein
LRARAQKEYCDARGTIHLKQIEPSLRRLDLAIESIEFNLGACEERLKDIEYSKTDGLKKALARHIVDTYFLDVPGIGPKLSDRIIYECFDGTIKSLTKAERLVEGVGPEKGKAIRKWAQSHGRKYKQYMKADFPKKEEILKEAKEQVAHVRKEIGELEKQRKALEPVQQSAMGHRNQLRTIRIKHFVRSYRGDPDASLIVTKYLNGAFPPWASMPMWFKKLISDFGD